jgi:magnesium chelatase family protein
VGSCAWEESNPHNFEIYPHLSQWFFARKAGGHQTKKTALHTKAPMEFDRKKFQETFATTLKILARHPQLCVALLAAAAGGHHILVAGEPGIGKSFSFRKYQDLLLPLPRFKAVEAQLIHANESLTQQPFRSPHHSCTSAALVGGASLKPGEVTLAHHGVLFLDELAEFPRNTLEALREPLDTENVTLARAAGAVSYPARFQLCATTNPCPCGYHFSRKRPCRCNPAESRRYLQKISGPLLDRFPLQVWLDPPDNDKHPPQARDYDPFVQALLKDLGCEKRLEALGGRFVTLQLERLGYADIVVRKIQGEEEQLTLKKNFARSEHFNQQLSFRGEDHLSAVGGTLGALFPEVSINNDEETREYLLGYRRLSGMFQNMV